MEMELPENLKKPPRYRLLEIKIEESNVTLKIMVFCQQLNADTVKHV